MIITDTLSDDWDDACITLTRGEHEGRAYKPDLMVPEVTLEIIPVEEVKTNPVFIPMSPEEVERALKKNTESAKKVKILN